MDDLIRRQDAIEELSYLQTYLFDSRDHDNKVSLEDVRYAIEQLPSAKPERKTGRWIPVTNGRGGHECDLCHNYAPSWQTGEEHLTDFCPNCGAYMREG